MSTNNVIVVSAAKSSGVCSTSYNVYLSLAMVKCKLSPTIYGAGGKVGS
jgi:hypothetical protein